MQDTQNFKLAENNNALETQYLIANPHWESQLQDFDPNLKLLLDKDRKRWVIAEFMPGNAYPNILFYLEDEKGNEKPFGPWVLNKLFVKQQRWLAYQRGGGKPDVDQYLKDMKYQNEKNVEKSEDKNHDERSYQISHDITKWRRAIAEMNNEPVSDVGIHAVPELPEKKGE